MGQKVFWLVLLPDFVVLKLQMYVELKCAISPLAAAAASITVSQKGAIPSMPDRAAVDRILELLVQATVVP